MEKTENLDSLKARQVMPVPEVPQNIGKSVPPAMLHKMGEYAKGYAKKHPGVSKERLTKIVAKKFNIKLT